MKENEVKQKMAVRTVRAFNWMIVNFLVVVGGFVYVYTAPEDNGIPWPLRKVMEMNGFISQSVQSNKRQAEILSKGSADAKPRFNGDIGLSLPFDPNTWKMTLVGGRSQAPIGIEQIKALPNIEYTTKFKCIEGWTQYLNAKGTRLSDFLKVYGPALPSGVEWDEKDLDKLPKWIGLETPDKQYYVGIDMKSALHPQTILCWQEDSRPLTLDEGAPLRLVIPIKYGIKHLKRIGTMTITNTRPKDYWFEQGYDYYAGH